MILRKATLLVILVFLALFMGCKSTTKPEMGVIEGFVELAGETNHSGITVLVQSANTIPEELNQITVDHPSQVFYSDQHAVFDHRIQPILGSTTTDERGFFSLPKVHNGEYIVTCIKEGWGFNNSQVIVLNESHVDINDDQDGDHIRLNREVLLPPLIYEDFVLQANVCYVAQDNVLVFEGTQLEFSPNSKLLINPNVNVNVLGSCVFPSNGTCLITSSSGVYGIGSQAVSLAGGFGVSGSTAEIRNAVFSFLFDGLVVNHDNVVIRNAAFCHNETGIRVMQSDGVSLIGSLIMENISVEYAAVIVTDGQNFKSENNLFYNNIVSILNRTYSECEIEACVFDKDFVSVKNLTNSICAIRHCLFKSASIAIRNSSLSNLSVDYCDIYADICIQASFSLYYNDPQTGWVYGSNNNLLADLYTLDFKDRYWAEDRVLDWTNNYWGTRISSEISDSIIDTNDLPPPPSSTYSFSEVEFSPFKLSMISAAGIH